MANLSLKHIDKIYDNNVQAVFDFNLEIADKEFIVFAYFKCKCSFVCEYYT